MYGHNQLWRLIGNYGPPLRAEAALLYRQSRVLAVSIADCLQSESHSSKVSNLLAPGAVGALCATEALAYVFYSFHRVPISEDEGEIVPVRLKFHPDWAILSLMHVGIVQERDLRIDGRFELPPAQGAMDVVYQILKEQFPGLKNWIDEYSPPEDD